MEKTFRHHPKQSVDSGGFLRNMVRSLQNDAPRIGDEMATEWSHAIKRT